MALDYITKELRIRNFPSSYYVIYFVAKFCVEQKDYRIPMSCESPQGSASSSPNTVQNIVVLFFYGWTGSRP